MKSKINIFMIFIVVIMTLIGCSNEKSQLEEEKTIKIGCMTITEPLIQILKEGMKDKGYNIEPIVFDGNHLPAEALTNGEINGVILNHKPWMEKYNLENDTHLAMPEPYMYHSRIDMYSSKFDSYEDIPDGATITIPGDPVNMDRALNLLQEINFIELAEKENPEDLYNTVSITNNIKNIKIIEAEVTATVRSFEDADAIIAGASNMKEAGFDHNAQLFSDPLNTEYPLGLIVNEEDINADWVKAIHEYQQTEEFIEAFNEHYDGAYNLYEY